MSYEQPDSERPSSAEEQNFQKEVIAFLERNYARGAIEVGTTLDKAATQVRVREILPQYLKLLKLSNVFNLEALRKLESRLISESNARLEANRATTKDNPDYGQEFAYLKEVKEFIHRHHSRIAARHGRTSNREILEEQMPEMLPGRLKALKQAGVHDIESLRKFEAKMVARYEAQAVMDQPTSLFEQYMRAQPSCEV